MRQISRDYRPLGSGVDQEAIGAAARNLHRYRHPAFAVRTYHNLVRFRLSIDLSSRWRKASGKRGGCCA